VNKGDCLFCDCGFMFQRKLMIVDFCVSSDVYHGRGVLEPWSIWHKRNPDVMEL
jgi:hypothetical protein